MQSRVGALSARLYHVLVEEETSPYWMTSSTPQCNFTRSYSRSLSFTTRSAHSIGRCCHLEDVGPCLTHSKMDWKVSVRLEPAGPIVDCFASDIFSFFLEIEVCAYIFYPFPLILYVLCFFFIFVLRCVCVCVGVRCAYSDFSTLTSPTIVFFLFCLFIESMKLEEILQ